MKIQADEESNKTISSLLSFYTNLNIIGIIIALAL